MGRALIGDVVLEVQPKIAGALGVLLQHASSTSFVRESLLSPATEFNEAIGTVAAAFSTEVENRLAAGRDWVYKRQGFRSSMIAGKLDVMRTMMLAARGQPHLAAFTKFAPTFQTPLNRLIAAALLEIEEIGRLGLATAETIHKARTLSMVYEDCLVSDVLYGSRDEIVEDAFASRSPTANEATDRIVALGSILVTRESTGGDSALKPKRGVSWFVDLEDLFEHAVRRTLGAMLPSNVYCTRGEDSPESIISGKTRPSANPDLVLKGENFVCVGDVKYKDLGDKEVGSSDLYQLLVHASAFSADKAFLIYPGQRTSIVKVGDACTGATVFECVVDIHSLEKGMSSILQTLIAQDVPNEVYVSS